MSYLGDFVGTETIPVIFTTVQATGAPTTLAGTPKLRVYKAGSTTESSDITPTVDFDSRTGLNLCSIDLTGDSGFYATGNDFTVVITAGTVNSVSVVGYVVAEFSILKRSPLRPTTAGRTLDVSAGGEAGVDWANVGSPTTANALTNTSIITTQKVDVDTIKTNPVVNGGTITFPTTATLASTTNLTAGTVATVSGNVNGSVGSVTGAVGSVTGAVGSVTGNVGGNVTGSAGSVVGAVGSVTGNVGGNVTGSTGSVVGAVGSVTGNVGGNVVGSVASVTGAVGSLTANNDKTGYTLSNTGIDNILDRSAGVETNFTLRQAMRLMLSSVVAKLSGAATATVVIRDINDTKDRITATTDASGNRTAVTTDTT